MNSFANYMHNRTSMYMTWCGDNIKQTLRFFEYLYRTFKTNSNLKSLYDLQFLSVRYMSSRTRAVFQEMMRNKHKHLFHFHLGFVTI